MLVIVVGILAVMMLMAGTLALLSRVGHQMSVSYDYSQALDALSDAVETYAIDTLHRDKYGTNGLPYSYELGYWDPLNLGLAYPTDGSRNGDDEGFDSHLNEEWLPNPEYVGGTPDAAWRAFQGQPYNQAAWAAGNVGVRVDLNGDGVYSDLPVGGVYDWMVAWRPYADLRPTSAGRAGLTGTDATARVSLYYEDLGGARIDVNAAGNAGNLQNQGLTPFEVDLSVVTVTPPGDMVAAAAALIAGRENGGAGSVAWLPVGNRLDRDAEGEIGQLGETDPTVYSPIYPDPTTTYAPFDNFDLNDLFQMTDTGSRVAAILTAAGIGTNDYYLFTTQSAGTSFAARPTPFSVGADTMLNQPFFSRGSGNALPSKRPLNEIVTQLSPRELADFLESLGPVVQAEGGPVSLLDRRRILRQTATNLKDMVDPDNVVSVWTDENHDTYCGVEVTPYVAEGEVAVPTWYLPWGPGPVREMLPDYLRQQVVSPTPPSPPLPHPGKYIKLVNPWNVPINLCDPTTGAARYKLVMPATYEGHPRLRDWVRVASADGEHSTLISIPWPTDVVIDWEDRGEPTDFVPARGHYIIVEDEATLRLLLGLGAGDPILLPQENYTIEPDLRFMQECIGRPLPGKSWYKWLRYTNPTGSLDPPPPPNPPLVLTGETSGHAGTVVLHDAARSLLFLVMADTGQSFVAGENLLGPNPPPDVRAQTSGVAEPIYDWFGDPPADTSVFDAWIGAALPPEVAASVGGPEGKPSAVQLFQVDADSPIMFTVLPDTTVTGAASYDDEDDWPLVTTTLSGQMDDPRPCWRRWDPETSGFESAEAPAPTVNNPGPWGRNAWDRLSKQTAGTWDPTDTWSTALPASWFNTNWAWSTARHDASRAVRTGDGWNVLYDPLAVPPALEDDVRYSFPPAAADAGVTPLGVAEYTNVPGPPAHQTAVMNLGLLSSPGDIGFVHAGMPWTTVSLGEYGQPLAPLPELVYLREFLDYVAAPILPYEGGPAAHGFRTMPVAQPLGPGPYWGKAVTDLNGDGRLDVVAANHGADQLAFFYGNGDGTFQPPTTMAVPNSPTDVAVADFSGDGLPDLVVSGAWGDNVSLYYRLAAGGFSGPTHIQVTNGAGFLSVGDFNMDGLRDVVVAGEAADAVTVLLQQPAGGLAQRADYLVGDLPRDTAVGDFSGDGWPDIAVANFGDGNVSVLYNTGHGIFGAPTVYAVGTDADALVAADFNRDGVCDLAIGCQTVGSMTAPILLYYGQIAGPLTGGAVTTQVDVDPFFAPLAMAAADFNGDGLLDLGTCSASTTPGLISFNVVYALPAGGFGNTVDVVIADHRSGYLVTGDFDGNGALDMVEGSLQLWVVLNQDVGSRVCGRVNVNTAPQEVLQAAMKQEAPPLPLGQMAAMAAGWIVGDRAANGPYTSVDDLIDRMVALVPPGPYVWGFRQEAFARFLCNLVTVRTDVWGVRGRVQLFRDNGIDPATGVASGTPDNGQREGNEEILSERQFYMVVDRSQRPIRVLLKRYLAE